MTQLHYFTSSSQVKKIRALNENAISELV